MKLPLWIAVLLLHLSCYRLCTAQAEDCRYKYVEQPLMEIPCNPYIGGEMRITCRVNGPLDEIFELAWFKQPAGSNQVVRLKQTANKIDFQDNVSDFESLGIRRQSSLLRVTNLNEQDDMGLYWCQISVTQSDGSEPLKRSNTLLLDSLQSYTSDMPCRRQSDSELSTVDEPKCADFETQATMLPSTQRATSEQESALPFTRSASTTEAEEESSSNQLVALFSVLGVIVVFSAVIITLTVVIVILYRKRYGHMGFKKTADRNSSTNPYSGFTQDQRGRSVSSHSNLTTRSERSDSRLASSSLNNSTTSPAPLVSSINDDKPYSRLVHAPHAPHPPPLSPPLPGDYSKLEQNIELPPPRPPKPPSMKSKSRTPPPPPIIQNSRRSQIRNEFSDLERGVQSSTRSEEGQQPPVNIYRTMDGHGNRDSYEYDYARQSGGWKVKSPDNEGGKGLFDDPEYSPLTGAAGRGKKKKKIEVIDPRYIGDYERSPTYTCPTVQLNPRDLDPKYRGDYEWDPTYVPKPPPRRASFSSDANRKIPKPMEVLQRRQSLEADVALHKYSGDYERNPNYVPPPLRNGSTKISPGTKLDHQKYVGNYERDPLYMANKLSGNSSEYTAPYLAGDQSWAELVPPHIPSEYRALEEAMKDPPQQYATLTSEPSDIPTSTV